jgi:hypothetical protein
MLWELLTSAGNAYANSQGLFLGWNKSGGTGESNLVNHRGLGAGGFYFDNYDGSTFTRLFSIDVSGFHLENLPLYLRAGADNNHGLQI